MNTDTKKDRCIEEHCHSGRTFAPRWAGKQIVRYALIGSLLYNGACPDVFLTMPLWQKAGAVLIFAAVADYGMGLGLCAGLFSRRLRKPWLTTR